MSVDVVTPNNPDPRCSRADVIAESQPPMNPLQQQLRALAKAGPVHQVTPSVKKPHKNASTEAWIAYAKAEDAKKLENMHRTELIKRFG